MADRSFLAEASALKAVYKCWYSSEIYREVARQWRGLGLRYLISVLVLIWIVLSLHVQFLVSQYYRDFVKPLAQSLPSIQISNGLLSIDRDERIYVMKDPRTGKKLITFDLTETPRDPPVNEDGIFIEVERMILHSKGKEEIHEFGNLTVSSKSVKDAVKVCDFLEYWVGVIVFGVMWLSSFVLFSLSALLYGLIGKSFAALYKSRLTYPQLVRISVVALTPSLVIDACQKLLCTGIPGWPFIAIVITLAFVAFGVKANSLAAAWTLTQQPKSQEAVTNSEH